MPPPPATRFLLRLLTVLALLLPAPAPADDDTPTPATQATPPPPPRESIPPAPDGLILDQARVLLPEATARLSARLVAARAADVYVYVVTIHSLGVAHGKQSDRLSEQAKEYSDAWLSHKVGGVILFDDESGLMTVEVTKETNRLFTSFAVEEKIKDALQNFHLSGLARDKVEFTAQTLVEILSQFQADHAKAALRERTANLLMGGVALLGIGLAIYSVSAKPKTPSAGTSAPAADRQSPSDF